MANALRFKSLASKLVDTESEAMVLWYVIRQAPRHQLGNSVKLANEDSPADTKQNLFEPGGLKSIVGPISPVGHRIFLQRVVL